MQAVLACLLHGSGSSAHSPVLTARKAHCFPGSEILEFVMKSCCHFGKMLQCSFTSFFFQSWVKWSHSMYITGVLQSAGCSQMLAEKIIYLTWDRTKAFCVLLYPKSSLIAATVWQSIKALVHPPAPNHVQHHKNAVDYDKLHLCSLKLCINKENCH